MRSRCASTKLRWLKSMYSFKWVYTQQKREEMENAATTAICTSIEEHESVNGTDMKNVFQVVGSHC